MRTAFSLLGDDVPLKSRRCVFALLVLGLVGATPAAAQDLDRGKPATKLFAESVRPAIEARAASPKAASASLYLFLQKHYASNSSSAWTLTSYLESVDSAKRGEKRAAANAAQPSTTRTPRSSLRPPMPVPGR